MTIKELIEQIDSGKIRSDISLQREIIYSDEKQAKVIDSIVNEIPLPAFYLWKQSNDELIVLDGKQRIEAIKRFWHNDLLYNGKNRMEYGGSKDQKDKILIKKFENTNLTIIECQGDENKKREIFNRINTLGVPLSTFEVLNGLYDGEYLRSLSQFVKQDKNVLKILKSNNRGVNQLEILNLLFESKKIEALGKILNDEISKNNFKKDESFESDQKKVKPWLTFVADIFDAKLYAGHKDILFKLAKKYSKNKVLWNQHKTEINNWLIKWVKSDDYKLTNNKYEVFENAILNIVGNKQVDQKRNFTQEDKERIFNNSHPVDGKVKCAICGQMFTIDEIEIDHKDPWSKGGRTVDSNAQILCRACNRNKGNKE